MGHPRGRSSGVTAASAAQILVSGSERCTGSIPPSASPSLAASSLHQPLPGHCTELSPGGTVGLAEPRCSRLWLLSPELRAAKAPLLISDPVSISYVRGLVRLLPAPFSSLFFPRFGCRMLQSAGSSSSAWRCHLLGWDMPPAVPHWGQLGLKPPLWPEFGLSSALVRKWQQRGRTLQVVGLLLCTRTQPAPGCSCHPTRHR